MRAGGHDCFRARSAYDSAPTRRSLRPTIEPPHAALPDPDDPSFDSAVEALADQGYELLERGHAEQALAVGERVAEAGYSAGYEIQALALADLGRKPEAIDVLGRGVAAMPGVWLNWQLLGNYLSDEGRYDDALFAYEAGLARDGDEAQLRYNRALVLRRMERWAEALQDCDAALGLLRDREGAASVESSVGGLYAWAFDLKADALEALGRPDESLECRREATRVLPDRWTVWMWLGSALSDDGDFPGAHAAYDRALECPLADRLEIEHNRLIVAIRQERWDLVLALTDPLPGGDWRYAFALKRVRALMEAGRFTEAVGLCEVVRSEFAAEPDLDRFALERSESAALGETAAALAEPDEANRGQVESDLIGLIREYPDEVPAAVLWALRRLRGDRPARAMDYELLVHCRLDDHDEVLGFYQSFGVVARTPAAACEAARELLGEAEWRTGAEFAECDEIGPLENALCGVYAAGVRNGYDTDGDDGDADG